MPPRLAHILLMLLTKEGFPISCYEWLSAAMDAYRAFDNRQPGWIKVELKSDVAMAAA